jgi:hypothetical protein
MTATTQYNQPYDLAPLVNLASGKKELPEGKEFNSKYLEIRRTNPGWIRRVLLGIKPEENVNIKNQKQLSAILSKYTDKHEDLAGEFFPEKSEKIVPVPMSKEQHQIYKAIEGKLPFLLRLKVRSGMPLDKKELANLNAFSTGMRQVSNTAAPYLNNYNPDTHSPKIDAALASLSEKAGLDKNFRGVVYSNYLDAGLKQYSEKLKKAKIPHSIYTGELTKAQKQKLVDEYNSGKSPVMLISSAGGEGLDLKGTKLIQVLEPHFNHSKIDQVVGRGARFKSHSHLPKEERKVEIEHFHSTFPDGVFGKSKDLTIDQYLHGVGSKKADIKDKIQEIIGN